MAGIMFPESFHMVKVKEAELASIKTAIYKQHLSLSKTYIDRLVHRI